MLAAAVPAATLVRDEPGRRADRDDDAVRRFEGGQRRLDRRERAEHVDLVHATPVVEVGARHGVGAERSPGVRDEDVDAFVAALVAASRRGGETGSA